MNTNEIVGAKPELFLGPMAGALIWWTREGSMHDIEVKSLVGCILLWNRAKHSSEVLQVFGLN